MIFETLKIPVEVIAILAGGLFALGTWGVDQFLLRQPNWDVSLSNVNEALLSYKSKVGCVWQGSVVTHNKGNRPLSTKDTELKFYLFPRPEVQSVAEYTGFVYEEKVCKSESQKDCVKPFHETTISELDDSLIFPQKKANRPFSIMFGGQDSQVAFDAEMKGKILLVRITQHLEVETEYGWSRETEARVNLLDPHICGVGLSAPEA